MRAGGQRGQSEAYRACPGEATAAPVFPTPPARCAPRRIGYAARVRVLAHPVVLSLCACAAACVPARALAQAPELHEYVPAISPSEARATGRGGAALPPTQSGAAAEGSEAGSGGPSPRPAAAASPENFRPDRSTSLEGGLDYYEAFSPAIAPFKRVTAFDAVRRLLLWSYTRMGDPRYHFGDRLIERADPTALEAAIAPYRNDPDLHWTHSEPSLEDVFIDLMSRAKDNFQ